MYYHSNIEKQLIEIFKNVDMDKYKLKCNENELSDITDGRIYRKLLMSEDGDLFRKKEAFSFLLNTDGISVCSKSKLTIWPFFLALIELPKEERYLIENMVLAGIIFNF